jgi:hypothetical protein
LVPAFARKQFIHKKIDQRESSFQVTIAIFTMIIIKLYFKHSKNISKIYRKISGTVKIQQTLDYSRINFRAFGLFVLLLDSNVVKPCLQSKV